MPRVLNTAMDSGGSRGEWVKGTSAPKEGVEEEERERKEVGKVLSWVPIEVNEKARNKEARREQSGKTGRKMSNK